MGSMSHTEEERHHFAGTSVLNIFRPVIRLIYHETFRQQQHLVLQTVFFRKLIEEWHRRQHTF